MTGVKQFLKPDAYKQSELQLSVIRDQGSESRRRRRRWAAGREPGSAVLMSDI
jgi:hypothetical protein